MEEKIHFESNGVSVTSARFVSHGTTYAMRNVTSVKMLMEKDPATAGIIALLIGLVSLFANPFLGVPLLLVGAFVLYRRKTTYSVVLATSGGETNALASPDESYVLQVVAALNKAIVERG